MKKILSVALATLLACASTQASPGRAIDIRPVDIQFKKSPYADFLFYLLYRHGGEHQASLNAALPLQGDGLPILISLPHLAIEAQGYADVIALTEPYRRAQRRVERMPPRPGDERPRYRILSHAEELPRFGELDRLVRSGEAGFAAFKQVWSKELAPREDAQIAVWKQQNSDCKPVERLQQMARMTFPHSSLTIGAVALHLSGSANTDPASITSAVWKKPNLPWTIGHEGTHLLVDEFAGARWKERPPAPEVIAKVVAAGGQAADIEEALSMLMQVKLAQACGTTAADYSLAAKLQKDGTPKYRIIVGLERDWPNYLSNHQMDLVDFMLYSAGRSMAQPQLP